MISAALAILENDKERNELSEIYENNNKTFYYIAFSKLHNKEDAEDAIQEAFLAVAKNPDILFKIPVPNRVSYIDVIIRNISYKMWNKKHRIDEKRIEFDYTASDGEMSTEDVVLSDYGCERTLKYIDTLPEGTRAVIYLRLQFGLTNSDIAKVLGISEEAARKRAERAFNKIKQYMKELGNE